MKIFLFKFTVLCLLLLITFLALPIIDPYNVFHYKNIRDNGVEPNKNYIKMRYILDNPRKFNAYLFGSSRVGAINVDNITALRCYNMTYSAGLPIEHFENLKVMLNNNIIPNAVLVGVDDISFFIGPKAHKAELMRMPYPGDVIQKKFTYTKFLIKYLNPAILASLPIIISHKGGEYNYREQFYENGGRSRIEDEQSGGKYDWDKAVPGTGMYSGGYGVKNALADIEKIVDLCERNNIRLIIFTNPLHELTYQYAVENGYLDFLNGLSAITNYYNFSGINDVTTNNQYYFETNHYKISVGDLIINTIFNNTIDEKLLSQGFGYYVTVDSKDKLLDILREQLQPSR